MDEAVKQGVKEGVKEGEPLEWVDGHLDLAYLAVSGRDMEQPAPAGGVVSFPALAEGHVKMVLGTIFVQRRVTGEATSKNVDGPWCYSSPDEAYAACLRQIEVYRAWERTGRIEIVRAGGEIDVTGATIDETGPLQVVLLLEGAAGIRSIDDLGQFHAAGLRAVGLAWSEGSPWAGGNSVGGGVTAAGRELVAALDRLEMIHDLSHLSEAAFWELMDLARGPRMASHSNCRELLSGKGGNLQRHLSDKQIAAIATVGGMIGINLYERFLVEKGRATINDVVGHIVHTAEVMGRRDRVGLGSDMDGGFGADLLPVDLAHPRCLPALAKALEKAGWSPAEVAGFAGGNWRRFLAAALQD